MSECIFQVVLPERCARVIMNECHDGIKALIPNGNKGRVNAFVDQGKAFTPACEHKMAPMTNKKEVIGLPNSEESLASSQPWP